MPNNPISPRKPCAINYVWRDLQKLSDFYKREHISVKDLDVSKKDIDFYRVLKSGNFVLVYDLNEMNKKNL